MSARNGWNSYQRLVLDKLQGLDSDVKHIRVKDIPGLQVEIAALKVKAGIWGAVAGLIPAALAIMYMWIHYPATSNISSLAVQAKP